MAICGIFAIECVFTAGCGLRQHSLTDMKTTIFRLITSVWNGKAVENTFEKMQKPNFFSLRMSNTSTFKTVM